MRWILLDVVLVLLTLAVVAVLALRLWRAVQALSRRVTEAGERLGSLGDELNRAQRGTRPRTLSGTH